MQFGRLAGAGAAVLLTTVCAHAHHPGGPGNVGSGPIVTISADTLRQGESSVAIMFEMTKVAAFSDAKLIDFASRHIHAHSMDAILVPSIAVAYGITNDLMVSARLPYVVRKDIREGHHDHGHGGHVHNEVVERGDTEGIGDMSALLQWRFLNNRISGTQAALLGGVKAPTGPTKRRDGDGELFEMEFQPGSGSWDFMVGAAISQRAGNLGLHANVLYTFAGDGSQDTNLGDRFQYNLAVSLRVMGGVSTTGAMHLGAMPEPMYHGAGRSVKDHVHVEAPRGPSLDLVLELNGEWQDYERTAGVKEENSGGNVIYLSPGVRLSGDKWSTFLSVGIPVVSNLNGVHPESDYRIVSGVSMSF